MSIPKIVKVQPLENLIILTTFDDGTVKKYDVKNLFKDFPVFKDLMNDILFQLVHVDFKGYAIAWNDYLDLDRYEIWENGY